MARYGGTRRPERGGTILHGSIMVTPRSRPFYAESKSRYYTRMGFSFPPTRSTMRFRFQSHMAPTKAILPSWRQQSASPVTSKTPQTRNNHARHKQIHHEQAGYP